MNIMSKFPALFIWVLLLIQVQQQVNAQFDGAKYMFIGHCYEPYTAGDKVDHRLETFDFSEFDGVWLGGDVCSEAMLNYSTVEYIDGIFNLGNPETHWSLGNHDARQLNWEWCEEFTNRKTYYAYTSNGITRIVMNSNLVPTNCEMLDEQFDIITAVCDTISMSSNLILLMHHGLWRGVPEIPPPITFAQSDLVYWNANCDSVNTQFVDVIYPKLVEVKQRGIDVTCIMGDMGSQLKKFDMFSADSVRFMGCGLHENDSLYSDQVLFIEGDPLSNKLLFNFHDLDSLVNAK